MKKLFLFAVLLFACAAQAQNLRWDIGTPGSAGVVTVAAGSYLVALGAVQLAWCNYPSNAGSNQPCTNYANTYPTISSNTPCATNTQVTLQGSNTCQATTDNGGAGGVWTAPGTYAYTLTTNGQTFGPYTVTLLSGVPSGSVGQSQVMSSTGSFQGAGATDCAPWGTLQACINQVIANGGGVAQISVPTTITSPVTVGNSNEVPVTLSLLVGGLLTDNVNSPGSPHISLYYGSAIKCDQPAIGNYTGTNGRVPNMQPGASASGSMMITNGDQTGFQNYAGMKGCYIADPNLNFTTAFSTAVVGLVGLDQISEFSHNWIDGFGVPLVLIENGTSTGGVGIVLEQNEIDCDGVANCVPLKITTRANNTGAPGNVTVVGGVYAHCGTAPCGEIEALGDDTYTQDVVGSINLIGPYLEAQTSVNSYGLELKAAQGIFGYISCGGGGSSTNYCLQVDSTSTNLSKNIQVFVNNATYTDTVRNQITGETIARSQYPNWFYRSPDLMGSLGQETFFPQTLSTINGASYPTGTHGFCSNCKNVTDDGATAGSTCTTSGGSWHGAPFVITNSGAAQCN